MIMFSRENRIAPMPMNWSGELHSFIHGAKKILFITRDINIQILTTEYFSLEYSAIYCNQTLRRSAHRVRVTVHLLTHETPDFITPALWPANSPDFNPTRFGEAAGACVPQPDS